jgi:hypothetical protein
MAALAPGLYAATLALPSPASRPGFPLLDALAPTSAMIPVAGEAMLRARAYEAACGDGADEAGRMAKRWARSAKEIRAITGWIETFE